MPSCAHVCDKLFGSRLQSVVRVRLRSESGENGKKEREKERKKLNFAPPLIDFSLSSCSKPSIYRTRNAGKGVGETAVAENAFFRLSAAMLRGYTHEPTAGIVQMLLIYE